MKRFWLLVAIACTGLNTVLAVARPNILWIISDDLGPELGCYGYSGVATPNIDRLAARGWRYSRAFSTAPVCSSSRSAFQTGRYQTSIGCHHHLTRDPKKLPPEIPTAIDLFRGAGYFISHGHGTVDSKAAKFGVNYLYDKRTYFDGHDWSQRKSGQPFFAQVHMSEPHRPFVRGGRSRPGAVIPPYYPDHPVTRVDWGEYLASIEALDRKVGLILNRLREEGLMDNTVIFFFGDHGRPHVRDKQWLYEGGLHTPLIVHWPARIPDGGVKDGLASLLDVMPTSLAAAGIQAPSLPGKDLFASGWSGHEVVFAARDRCGDAADRIRSVRSDRFKYIRNFHPERPYLQHSGYKKLSYPVLTLMNVMHQQNRWDSLFMVNTRPPEELYDLSVDPYELKNLAADPGHAAQLSELRGRLDRWIRETGDQGSIEEALSVDLESVMKSKRDWYENTLKRRGLEPDVSDEAYLAWWRKSLGVD